MPRLHTSASPVDHRGLKLGPDSTILQVAACRFNGCSRDALRLTEGEAGGEIFMMTCHEAPITDQELYRVRSLLYTTGQTG
jgi:hypothetical protein